MSLSHMSNPSLEISYTSAMEEREPLSLQINVALKKIWYLRRLIMILHTAVMILKINLQLFIYIGSIQPRAVHPLPNAKDVHHIFFHVSALHEVRHLGSSMIVVVFLFSSYRAVSTGKSSLAIPRRCPYHLNCLLWILSKIDCSACILFLMAVLGIFCNLDTLADLFLELIVFFVPLS